MIQDDLRNKTTDAENRDEMMWRVRMDRSLTSAMGGPLAALSGILDGTRILDLACGPGETAFGLTFWSGLPDARWKLRSRLCSYLRSRGRAHACYGRSQRS